jgi:hypothetical protein
LKNKRQCLTLLIKNIKKIILIKYFSLKHPSRENGTIAVIPRQHFFEGSQIFLKTCFLYCFRLENNIPELFSAYSRILAEIRAQIYDIYANF